MTDASDIIDKAKKRAAAAKEVWGDAYRAAKDDLHFLSDAPYAQWDENEYNDRIRVGRPALQIDQLSQFVHQVSNDIRMNTPTIKVIPAGMDSDPETAEIISGRIKAIEYKSNADAAYDMAADFSVKSSIGFIRVDRGYVDDDGFEQELKICRVTNPMAIYIDPDSTEPDGSDAKFAFVFDEITQAEFKRIYPEENPLSFGSDESDKPKPEEMVVIAEYFYIEETEEEYGLLDNGKKEKAVKGKKYKNKRKIAKRVVHHCKLSGDAILEETIFPGKYIPIVPVYGEEAWENGKRKLFSLIRKSKSAQRMYNLWKSLETELLLKQQQSPVQAAVGQMRDFEDDWKKPEKSMVLYYHQDDAKGNPAPPPQRLQPPTIPTGIVNAARETVDDIKATMGLYNASLGQRSNEQSGIAIQRRQQEGDVATFHFGDNLVRSITQVGRIIVSALPEIEDSPRTIQIIGEEDEIKQVGINGVRGEEQEQDYDFTKGKYDVRVVTGASFTTQRQEAAQLYTQIIQSMPDLMPVIGDLVFKYQDTPGAMAISARLKKLVDPKLLDESEREEGIDPQVMQLTAQLQEVATAAQKQIQQLQAELENKQAENLIKMGELKIKQEEVAIKSKEADIKAADVKVKFIQATKAPEQIQQPQISSDDSIEVLNARIAEKLTAQEMAAQQQAIEQEQQMIRHRQEQMMEMQEQALKAQELEQRQIQAAALIETLTGISAQLGQLTNSVSQPINVIRDEAGNIIGAS